MSGEAGLLAIFKEIMNRLDHLLWNVAEECAETAQRASKTARFSLSEVQPGQSFNNADRLFHEYADLVAVMEMLVEEGYMNVPADFKERVAAKKVRFDKYLKRSAESGTLD